MLISRDRLRKGWYGAKLACPLVSRMVKRFQDEGLVLSGQAVRGGEQRMEEDKRKEAISAAYDALKRELKKDPISPASVEALANAIQSLSKINPLSQP